MSFIQQFFTSRDNNANAETFVGQEGRLWWNPLTNQIYSSDGNTPGGIPLAGGGGGNGSPGGINGQVQFNQAGTFGGTANLTINTTTGALSAVSFVGNGAPLTSITGANVTGTVADATHAGVADSANSVAGANVTGTVAEATHAASADSATSATTAGTVTTNAQPNITSVGTLSSVNVTGNITGGNVNVNSGRFSGGSLSVLGSVTGGGLSTAGNLGVSGNAAVGNLSATGNITGTYYIGNGSLLTGIATSSYGNSNVTTLLAALGSNVISSSANIITTANIAAGNISVTGSVNLAGQISAVGNITGGNLLTGANVSAFGNVTGGNLISTGLITTVGNVNANYFIGNGSALFAITGANVNGNVANATYAANAGSATTATSATTAGTVTTNAQPNITSVGTLTSVTSTGNISTTGNVTGNYFVGNGSALTSITGANVTGNVANATYALSANSASSLVNGASVVLLNSDGTMTFPSNVINSNANPITLWSTNSSKLLWRDSAGGAPGQPVQTIVTAGNGSATITVATGFLAVQSQKTWTFDTTGNVTFPDATVQTTAYPGTATSLSVSGNVTGGNINTAGQISATGNITGGNIIGTHVGNITGTTASLSGNVTGGNILTGGLISAAGNLTSGNLTTTTANFATFNSSIGGNVIGTLVSTSANAQFINQTNAAGYATVAGYLSVAGNVTGGNILTGGLISSTGNATAGNISTGGLITATGNITATANIAGGNILIAGQVSATGNATAGNISTGGLITATGNITATANISGGNLLTAGISSATGNATFGNISTVGLITATGNITVGNVNTGGRMSATGNILGGNLTVTGFGTVTYTPASTTGYALQLNAANTVGGAGYGDFLRATNTSGGATNPNKSFRVNNIGTLEILNSAYTAVALSVSDSGQLALAAAATANNDPTSNWLSFNNNNAAIYDDGNFHIHARGNGSNMWINAGNAAIIIGNQATTSGGSPATGVIMGSSSSIKAYLSVYGSKTYAIGTYGYLATSGAGTGASTTASYSIYSDNRMNASEFDATSDERAKDIQGTIPLDQALKFVRVVDGLLYTWNGLAVDSDPGLKAGFSAQRVHKAGFDHMIGVVENEKMKEQVDEDGWVHPEGYQLTMGYNQAVPYHHEVIKHLLDRVEQLEATIAKLTK